MTSVSPPAASSGKVGDEAPPLICAPCYICLEDGPDEEGKPLIRECSCRGESSAGYHLSCVINYAKAKTRAAVEEYEAGGDDWDFFGHHWMKCVNCKQEYEESLCAELAKGMVDYVASLVSDPDTHYLHYKAKKDMLTRLSSITEHAKEVQKEIISLLRLWEKRKSDIFRRWEEREDETICHMKEKDSLLYWLGIAQLQDDEREKAVETWEQALRTKWSLKNLVGPNTSNNDDEDDGNDIDWEIKDIERTIRDVIGRTTLGETENELRREITNYVNKNHHQEAHTRKSFLAWTLLNKEPPEYEEAISLLEEASKGLERILGAGHKEVAEVNDLLATAKEESKTYLALNDCCKDDHAGNKRKRNDEN